MNKPTRQEELDELASEIRTKEPSSNSTKQRSKNFNVELHIWRLKAKHPRSLKHTCQSFTKNSNIKIPSHLQSLVLHYEKLCLQQLDYPTLSSKITNIQLLYNYPLEIRQINK